MVAPQRVVDRWNYIINDLCVAVKMGAHGPGCRLSVPEPSCERLMCRPAVGQAQSLVTGRFRAFQKCPDGGLAPRIQSRPSDGESPRD